MIASFYANDFLFKNVYFEKICIWTFCIWIILLKDIYFIRNRFIYARNADNIGTFKDFEIYLFFFNVYFKNANIKNIYLKNAYIRNILFEIFILKMLLLKILMPNILVVLMPLKIWKCIYNFFKSWKWDNILLG